jgi:hypothetical protein
MAQPPATNHGRRNECSTSSPDRSAANSIVRQLIEIRFLCENFLRTFFCTGLSAEALQECGCLAKVEGVFQEGLGFAPGTRE